MDRTKHTRDESTSDGDRAITRMEYDWSVVTPSTAVAETVAATMGRNPTLVRPLYDYVDTDALNQFVARGDSGRDEGRVSVAFEYGELRVAVHGNGLVVVQPVTPV